MAMNFLIEDGKAQTVLVRAAGPALSSFQLSGVLPDPAVTIYNSRGAREAGNDNWGGTSELIAAFSAVGAFPFPSGSRDAALLFNATPGMYTAVVSDARLATGLVQLEIYEYQPLSSASRLPYVAGRANAGAGSNIVTASAIVGPSSLSYSPHVILRGLGPALAERGIAGTLGDPAISIGPKPVLVNDNWTSDLGSSMAAAGLLPLTLGSRDAAVASDVPLGVYSLQLGGVGSGTGIGMLEVANTDFRPSSIAPALLVPPYSVSGPTGGNVTLSAVAAGRPAPTYQWLKNGTAIAGATAPTLRLIGLRATDEGAYSVVLSNSGGQITSERYAVSLLLPPSIPTPPTSMTVAAGSSPSFTVGASGATPLSYQWFRDGVPIAGATSQTLLIPNVQPADAGSYTVRVTNTLGFATSPGATLTVLFAPAITAQPVSTSVSSGAPASLSVAATGSPPLTFQWRRNDVNIAGATNATFTIPSTRLSDDGSYYCVVSNQVGFVNSAVARLAIEQTFAGTYFGTFSQTAGGWALVVRRDGIATFLAFLNNPRSGILLTFKVGANGTLSANGPLIQSTTAGPARNVTLAAAIDSSDRVTGTLPELGITLGGAREAPGSDTAAFAGMYQANGPDNWVLYLIVGSSRQVMALFIHGAASGITRGAPVIAGRTVAALNAGTPPPDGGSGQVGADGSVDVNTPNGGNVFGRLTNDGFSGEVSTPSDPPVNVSGQKTEGLGAPVLVTPPAEQSVVVGSSVTLSVVAGGATPLSYQWKKDGVVIASATEATYTIAAAQRAHAGSYTCEVTNAEDRAISPAARLTVTAPGPVRLVNLSVQTALASAADNFQLGFVVTGPGNAKPLVVRAVGPSLAMFGTSGAAADPRLQLFVASAMVAENDDWGGSPELASAMSGVGAFGYSGPTSKDAALIANVVATGTVSSTAIVSATGPGIVVAELYDASTDTGGRRLRNVSVLKSVGAALIAGFVIKGTGLKRVLVRAVGPGLASAPFFVDGAIGDPQITLRREDVVIRANDNWEGADLEAAFRTAGAFPLSPGSRDAAMVVSLGDGEYTAQVTGVNNAGGVCLIEIYDLDP